MPYSRDLLKTKASEKMKIKGPRDTGLKQAKFIRLVIIADKVKFRAKVKRLNETRKVTL